jgi:hypothetical protein
MLLYLELTINKSSRIYAMKQVITLQLLLRIARHTLSKHVHTMESVKFNNKNKRVLFVCTI